MILKLLHWNILYKEKIENILDTIKKINPDIICLQELSQGFKYNNHIDTSKYLAQKLNYPYYYRKDLEGKNRTIGNGIFSFFPIIKNNFYYLMNEKEVISRWENLSIERRVYIEVFLKINNKILTVGTTHLSYAPRFVQTLEKRKEVDNLINIIKYHVKNYIVTGDFNSAPLSYTIDKMQDYFKNCGPEVSQNTWPSYPQTDIWNWRVEKLKWRLDYVFATKDIKIVSSKIIKTDFSDHSPILLRFDF